MTRDSVAADACLVGPWLFEQPRRPLSLDAGVDSHDFRPIDIERIREHLAGRTDPFSSSAGAAVSGN